MFNENYLEETISITKNIVKKLNNDVADGDNFTANAHDNTATREEGGNEVGFKINGQDHSLSIYKKDKKIHVTNDHYEHDFEPYHTTHNSVASASNSVWNYWENPPFKKSTKSIKEKFLMNKKENEELDEESMASDSLKPGSKYADPMSKVQMMDTMMNTMGSMPIHDLTQFFHAVMAQFGPNKEYGVGDNSEQNRSTVAMKTNVKEDLDVIFNGHELSEEFKESTAVLFEAALNAKLATETARLEEQYAEVLEEEVANIADELTNKLDSYLNYVVENFMTENEVAIESTLRNELMEEFMVGLKNLFAEHYISVPEERVDVLEAMVDKVSILENRLDETLTENTQLREVLISEAAKKVFVEVASDLALTQQEKFASLAEGIEFDGDLETFEKKLKIIKENYFRNESTSYSSNIEEETFEGDISQNVNIDPQVNRYVQAIARTIKK